MWRVAHNIYKESAKTVMVHYGPILQPRLDVHRLYIQESIGTPAWKNPRLEMAHSFGCFIKHEVCGRSPIFSRGNSALIQSVPEGASRGKLVCDRLDVPDGEAMRKTISAAVLLLAPLSLQAKDKPAYEKGEQVQMNSTSFGHADKDGQQLAGEDFGTDG